MSSPPARRHLVLPAEGRLMVSADLHGNGHDFRRLRSRFLQLDRRHPGAHWVLLGDLVHGPDADSRDENPALYGFRDESWEIVEQCIELRQSHPAQVHFLLGNHDHGHIGGPHTHKFQRDEVVFLEAQLGQPQREALREFLSGCYLAVAALCGVLLTHGSPGPALTDLRELDSVELDVREASAKDSALLSTVLRSYGQKPEDTDRMLSSVGSRLGLDLRVVIHGHDRDEEGFFAEGGNQLCTVLFGAPDENKRYLELDLGARYEGVSDLRDGQEIKRLYPSR
jgi:hypothetical protein